MILVPRGHPRAPAGVRVLAAPASGNQCGLVPSVNTQLLAGVAVEMQWPRRLSHWLHTRWQPGCRPAVQTAVSAPAGRSCSQQPSGHCRGQHGCREPPLAWPPRAGAPPQALPSSQPHRQQLPDGTRGSVPSGTQSWWGPGRGLRLRVLVRLCSQRLVPRGAAAQRRGPHAGDHISDHLRRRHQEHQHLSV